MTWFALATYREGGGTRAAIANGDQIHDLERVSVAVDIALPAYDVTALIESWETSRLAVQRLAAAIANGLSRRGDVARAALAAPFRPHRISAPPPTISSMQTR